MFTQSCGQKTGVAASAAMCSLSKKTKENRARNRLPLEEIQEIAQKSIVTAIKEIGDRNYKIYPEIKAAALQLRSLCTSNGIIFQPLQTTLQNVIHGKFTSVEGHKVIQTSEKFNELTETLFKTIQSYESLRVPEQRCIRQYFLEKVTHSIVTLLSSRISGPPLNAKENRDDAGLRYVAGFVLRKLILKHKSTEEGCIFQAFVKSDTHVEQNEWFVNGVDRGRLIHVVNPFFLLIKCICVKYKEYLLLNLGRKNKEEFTNCIDVAITKAWLNLVGPHAMDKDLAMKLLSEIVSITMSVTGKATQLNLIQKYRMQNFQCKSTKPLRTVLKEINT